MYNAKTPALPTTVGYEARIILKLQPVLDDLVKKGADFDWIGGMSGDLGSSCYVELASGN